MMRKPVNALWERLSQLRMSAAILYDKAHAEGIKPEEIAKSIEPLSKALNETVVRGVKDDFSGIVFAIHALEHQAEAHEQDAKLLLMKAADCRHHVEQIKRHLIEYLKEHQLQSREEYGFSATLSVVNGRDVVVVR